MRITFLLPYAPLAGGVRVALIHAEALRQRGHDVTLATPPPSRQPRLRDRLRGFLNGQGPHPKQSGKGHFTAFGGNHIFIAGKSIPDPSILPDADVVIATWWEFAYSVMTLPPEKGRKVYFVQGHEVHDHLPSHISAGTYYLPMKKIAVSSWLRDLMGDLYGDTHVSVVPNSVDRDQFHAPPRGRQSVPTVGFLFSQGALKGADLAADVVARTRRHVPGLRVVSFGKSAARPGHELPEGTTYFRDPPQDELRKIYAMCDIWLVPSRSEGFGLPIVEAMACRTPVVSTCVGAASDLIKDGENGFLVGVEDAETMAAKVMQLLSAPEEVWLDMSERTYATVDDYSWSDATDLFERSLMDVVKAQRTSVYS